MSFLLLGCSRRDPFDRVMDYVSHEWIPSYLYMPIDLPATASPPQLISALKVRGEFDYANVDGGSIKIVETRSVHVAPPIAQAYTAVLLDTDHGQMIVLFQPEPLHPKGKWQSWYWKIYDVKSCP